MTISKRSIPPLPSANPNIESGTDIISISPIALWPISIIPSVHELSGVLDIERLENAIRAATAIWPTIAGRYRRDTNQNFGIQLTSSSIPLEHQTLERDDVFPTRNVIQPSLEPFLPPLHPEYHLPNSDHPLLAIRSTFLTPSNRTILGITWAHILGDAFACNLFIRHLAWLYVNPDGLDEIDRPPLPTFLPHVNLPSKIPEDATEDLKEHQIHQITPTYPPAIASELYKQNRLNSDLVVISLTRKELGRMIEEFRESEEGSNGQLSSLDVITGWWIGVLQQTGVEIRRVIYTINYRTLYKNSNHFPPNLPTLASNVAQMLAIPLPPLHAGTGDSLPSPVTTAQAIRKRLQQLRTDEQEGLNWLSCIADSLEDAARKTEGQLVLPVEGEVLVNSNLRFDWNIPFGFPSDQSAFYTSGSGLHALRVCEANPLPGQVFGETNVELVFRVRNGTKEITESIMEADRRRWA